MLDLFAYMQSAPSNGWNPAETLSAGLFGLQVAAALNSDGRLEVFVIGGDFQLYHAWQSTPGGPFSALTQFPGVIARQIVLARNADGRLEFVYVGVDHSVWHNWQTTPAGAEWGGGSLNASAKRISLVTSPSGELQVLLIGNDDYIYFGTQTAPNATDWNVSRYNAQALTAVGAYDANGWFQMVYATTSDNPLQSGIVWSVVQRTPGVWAPSISLSAFAKDLTFLKRADGRLELFLIDETDRILRIPQTGSNGAWEPPEIFGGTAQQLCLCQDSDTRYDLVYIGMDGYLYQLWQTAPDGPWAGGGRAGGGYAASHICGTRTSDGSIALFGIGHVVGPTATETPTYGGLGSWSNYSFYNAGRALHGITVSVSVSEDLVVPSGFSIQLNGQGPTDAAIVWQQFTIMYDGTTLTTQINNWRPADLSDNSPVIWPTDQTLATISGGTVPKGTTLAIALTHEQNEAVTAATFTATDGTGKQLGRVSVPLSSASGFAPGLVSPLLAYQVVIVGQNGGAHASFSSGSGIISYVTAAATFVVGGDPSQTGATAWPYDGNVLPSSVDYTLTAESADTTYVPLVPLPVQVVGQSFGVAPAMPQRARPRGRLRRAAGGLDRPVST